MKLNDLVSFRRGRDKTVSFGVLVAVDPDGFGVIMRDGVKYIREMKRIKSRAVGQMELNAQYRRRQKLRRTTR